MTAVMPALLMTFIRRIPFRVLVRRALLRGHELLAQLAALNLAKLVSRDRIDRNHFGAGGGQQLGELRILFELALECRELKAGLGNEADPQLLEARGAHDAADRRVADAGTLEQHLFKTSGRNLQAAAVDHVIAAAADAEHTVPG